MPANRRPQARHLLALLQELRKAPSPLARARLLVRSAGALRRMSREERLRLVTAVGFERAEELVDRMEDDGDTGLRRLLQDLLARFEAAGPKRWAEMAQALREPEGRRRLVRQGVDLLTAPAAGEAEAEAAAPDEESADETRDAEPAALEAEGPQTGTAPTEPARGTGRVAPVTPPVAPPPPPGAPARPGPAAAPPKGPAPPAAAPVPSKAVRGGEPEADRPAAAAATPPVAAAPAAVSPPPRRAPAAAPPARPPRRPEPQPEPAGPPPSDEPPAAPLAAAAVVRRLARLRRSTGDLEEAGTERLRRLLDGFPAGWPRRRALMTLLRAGIPADLDAALELVETTQDRPAARLFCLGALAARPDLGAEETERLLAAAASGTERRRLSLRLARHRRSSRV